MGGSSSSYSESHSYTTNTTYEPDRVKAAEIEARGKIQVAKLEGNNITLRKQAAIEIIELNARMHQLIVDANTNGFVKVTNALLDFNRKLNTISEERFRMMEHCSLDAITKINDYYRQINNYIEAEGSEFMTKKLPLMLNQLRSFEVGSDAYIIYKEKIEEMIQLYIKSQSDWIVSIRSQNEKLFNNTIEAKNRIDAEISKSVENRMKLLERSIEQNEKIQLFTHKIEKQIESEIIAKN